MSERRQTLAEEQYSKFLHSRDFTFIDYLGGGLLVISIFENADMRLAFLYNAREGAGYAVAAPGTSYNKDVISECSGGWFGVADILPDFFSEYREKELKSDVDLDDAIVIDLISKSLDKLAEKVATIGFPPKEE